MEYKPLVSVIIPTYNRANFIIEAVESALNQGGCELEIVVIDDGSTDDTEVVLKKYCDKGLVSYYKQINKGPAAARNLGIKNSKGEYICFLDADDTLQQNSINERLDAYLKYPSVGLLCTDFIKITLDNDNQVVDCEEFSRKKFLQDAMDYIKTVDGSIHLFHREIFFDPLVLRCLIWTGTVMIPRYVFEKVGVFNEELRIAEDIELWFRIAKEYEMIFMSDSTATYLIHDGCVTKNKKLFYEATIKVFKKYLEKEYKTPNKYKNKIKMKISEYYFFIGYHLYKLNKYKQSNYYFKNAMIHNLRARDYYKYYAVTLLPDNLIELVRNVKRQMF